MLRSRTSCAHIDRSKFSRAIRYESMGGASRWWGVVTLRSRSRALDVGKLSVMSQSQNYPAERGVRPNPPVYGPALCGV